MILGVTPARGGSKGVPEPEEIPGTVAARLPAGRSASLVLLNSGEHLDVKQGTVSAPFTPPDPAARRRYVEEVLVPKRLAYEGQGTTGGPTGTTRRSAHLRFFRRPDVFERGVYHFLSYLHE